ncbi:unnamed protein product [Phytophthora lilii]|uniref:Unnamed protein product n=1 Tax=Phytophthora lilii TaxID=2077276 RepID=A0A9W6YGW8_9STRA|nr:unnamed protein product [Phytophthora lilii]
MGDSAASAGSDPAAPGSYDAQMREMQAIQQSVQRVLEWARRNQVEKVELLAPVPTQENTGDRERKTPSSGDEEFFLGEFDTTSTFTTSASDNKRRLNEDAGKDPQKPPGSLKGRIVVPVQSTAKSLASVGGGGLAASSGSKGSLCVRLLLKKQEAVSFTAAVESCEEGGRLTGQWNRAVFMRSARSAKQQAEAEMAAQVWWGQKFAAGRLHSMIRCDDEIDKIDGEAEDSFSLLNGGSGGKAALPATRGKTLNQVAQHHFGGVVGVPSTADAIYARKKAAKSLPKVEANASNMEEVVISSAPTRTVPKGLKNEVFVLLTEGISLANLRIVTERLPVRDYAASTAGLRPVRVKGAIRPARIAVIATSMASKMVLSKCPAKRSARWTSV